MTLDQLATKSYFLTSSNAQSFSDAPLIAEMNNALDRVETLILQSDNRWQYDDSNNTDLPIATTALAANQQDYSLAVSHLEITRVEVKDTSGNWTKLIPIDQADIYNQAMTAFLNTPGLPIYYDKLGNSVFLYPQPNYAQSASLKLYFKRGPSYFSSVRTDGIHFDDANKSPGFNALFHDLIPLWVAYNFALANGKQNATALFQEIQSREESLQTHYSLRDKDDRPSLKSRPADYR